MENFDYLCSLQIIREALRKNDTSTLLIEVLKFLSHPLTEVTDENTRYYLEFNSLITKEREHYFSDLAVLYAEKRKIFECYQGKIEGEKKKIDEDTLKREILDLLCDKWDSLYTCKTDREKSSHKSWTEYEPGVSKRVEVYQFRILILPPEVIEDNNENPTWFLPFSQSYNMEVHSHLAGCFNRYLDGGYDRGDSDDETPYNSLQNRIGKKILFTPPYTDTILALKDKQIISDLWDYFLRKNEKYSRRTVNNLDKDIILWKKMMSTLNI
jgi:hypothetical protein